MLKSLTHMQEVPFDDLLKTLKNFTEDRFIEN
jgi:hypothetical protein